MTLGAPFAPDDVEALGIRELTIDAIQKQHVAVDGEVIMQTPIRVSVAPKALFLMVPQEFQESAVEDH
jgi:diacylglycerol kinase family enzyme